LRVRFGVPVTASKIFTVLSWLPATPVDQSLSLNFNVTNPFHSTSLSPIPFTQLQCHQSLSLNFNVTNPFHSTSMAATAAPFGAGFDQTRNSSQTLLEKCQFTDTLVLNWVLSHSAWYRKDLRAYAIRKVDVRLPGKGNSNSYVARQVHLFITMIKWIRSSRLSRKNSPSTPSGGSGFRIQVFCLRSWVEGSEVSEGLRDSG